MSERVTKRRYLIILLALLVFLLALGAKLSLYDQPLHANAINSAKLWQDAQKIEVPSLSVLVFAISGALALYLKPRFQSSTWRVSDFNNDLPVYANAFEPSRFLRPPPSI